MTEQEYIARVESFFKKEGLDCLSSIDSESEPYFSWSSCDVCHRPLGGNREDWQGWNPTTKEIQGPYEVCTDCILYIANGDLPERFD